MRWFEHQRQEWIWETLRVFGFIQRQHLVNKFGVSVPQASADLQRFQRERPGMMTYDKTSKRYVGHIAAPWHNKHTCFECETPLVGPLCPKCNAIF